MIYIAAGFIIAGLASSLLTPPNRATAYLLAIGVVLAIVWIFK